MTTEIAYSNTKDGTNSAGLKPRTVPATVNTASHSTNWVK